VTDTAANSPSPAAVHIDRWPAVSIGIAFFILCSTLAGICWWAAGPTLGLFLGPPALLALVIPQVVSATGRARHRWLIFVLATFATGIIWFAALPGIAGANARQVISCVIILAAFNLSLIGLTDALLWSGIRPTPAAAAITFIFLVWLTWPIWLSAHLAGHWGESIANSLVLPHPLFAMTAVLHFDLWDHYPFMYSTLSTLNQDVPYRVPPSIWPSVKFHAIPGALIILSHPLVARHANRKKLNRQDTKTPRQ
jgi:hypothetical protein